MVISPAGSQPQHFKRQYLPALGHRADVARRVGATLASVSAQLGAEHRVPGMAVWPIAFLGRPGSRAVREIKEEHQARISGRVSARQFENSLASVIQPAGTALTAYAQPRPQATGVQEIVIP